MKAAPELRYPTTHRIDFTDPKVAELIYDLFDQLRIVPSVERLHQIVPMLVSRGLTVQEQARDLEVEVKDAWDEAHSWEYRVEGLEREVVAIDTQLRKAQRNLKEADFEEIDTLQGQIDTLQGQIELLKGGKRSLQTQVDGLTGRVAYLEDEKAKLEAQIQDIDW